MTLATFWSAHQAAIRAHGFGRAEHSCGACTLCCTVMKVEMSPPKPAYDVCEHCTGRGCGIYADRPDPCRGFQCLWLASQMAKELSMPAELRPDRTGVAIDVNAAGTVIAHCARDGSWRREPIRTWLLRYAAETDVILERPSGAELLQPNGNTERLVKVGVHASGNRLYVRESQLDRLAREAAA